jgi:hypothetical protein
MRGGALGEKGKNIEPLGNIGKNLRVSPRLGLLYFTCGKV